MLQSVLENLEKDHNKLRVLNFYHKVQVRDQKVSMIDLKDESNKILQLQG